MRDAGLTRHRTCGYLDRTDIAASDGANCIALDGHYARDNAHACYAAQRTISAAISRIIHTQVSRMNHLKIRLFAVALVVIGAGLVYVNWRELLHAHKYSTKIAAFAPLCVVAGLFLIAFPGFSGKPNTTQEKLVGALVLVIGLLAGLLNWYWMDPRFFGR